MPSKRPTSRPSKKPSSSPDPPEEPDPSPPNAAAAVLETPKRERDRDRDRSPNSKKPKPSVSTSAPEHQEPDVTNAAAAGDASRKSHRKRKPREFQDDGDHAASGAIVKVWTDDDEAALLRAAAAFLPRVSGGTFPRLPDMPAFFESVKESLSPTLTQDQVYNKLRRLKGKFLKNPNPTVVSTPHDLLVYKFSSEIWGAEGKKPEEEIEEKSDGAIPDGDPEDYPLLSEAAAAYWRRNPSYLHEVAMQKGMEMLDGVKAKALEERWRKHCEAEMVIESGRAALTKQLLDILTLGKQKGSGL